MAITLRTETITAKTTKLGSDTVNLTAGEVVQIRIKTPTVDLLNEQVPAGKKWKATISVYIEETNA